MKYIVTVNTEEYLVEINVPHQITVNGTPIPVDFRAIEGEPVYSLLLGGRSYEAIVEPHDGNWHVLLKGDLYDVTVTDERESRLRETGKTIGSGSQLGELRAPMPGLIASVPVQVGQVVQQGQILVILEAMKMQNELKSPRAGTVTAINIKPSQGVEQNQILVLVS